jgi:HEAT repeat protein
MLLAASLLGAVVTTARADDGNQEIINMVIDALKSDDPEMQTGAIAIVRDIPGAAVTKALAQELPNLAPAAQVQLLSALADRGDAAALPAVMETTTAENESVRVAALRAVGQLGDASSVPMLAERAASSRGDEQKAARESLYRLRGPEIDAAVLKNLPEAEPKPKVELISAIGERNITQGIEALLTTAQDEDRKVRSESLKVLRIVAGPQDLPALINLTLELESKADRTEAEKMIAAVAHKIEDEKNQAAAVLAVLPNVKDVADRASLLRVLGRIGDSSALTMLRTALNSREEEIQDAAIRALSEWPTAEPVPDLLKVAQNSENRVHRILALRGFVRLLALGSDRPEKETVELYQKAMELAPNALEKKRVLSGLGDTRSLAALEMATGYLDDLALHLEAEMAAVQIAKGIYGSYPQQCKELLQKVMKATQNDTIRKQAQEVIQQVERFDDYITAWKVSGPYAKQGADQSALFDVAFAPEKEGEEAEWRIMAPGTSQDRPWLLEFDKDPALAGENRLAYLRTRVWSPKEQKAQLEMGSDDGIKVWLNGELVHANNATRPASPGQDKAEVTLKEGWNPVLVKVTQGGGEWAACVRVRRPDGNKLEGLKFEAQ